MHGIAEKNDENTDDLFLKSTNEKLDLFITENDIISRRTSGLGTKTNYLN